MFWIIEVTIFHANNILPLLLLNCRSTYLAKSFLDSQRIIVTILILLSEIDVTDWVLIIFMLTPASLILPVLNLDKESKLT